MLQEYLFEIIAFIIISTSITIYLLRKKYAQEEQDMIADISDSNQKTSYKTDEDVITEFQKSDEPKIEEKKAHIFKARPKVEVPSHGSIKKGNFKEFSGVKLLVAEDNLINQKVIKGLLQDSGIEITMADDGQVALDILKENCDFNMILMDAHMPNIDGFQATRIIRANPDYEHIVVVALSGDTAADDIQKMIDAGMEEQLEKPLRMDSLYDVLYAYTKSDTDENEFVEVIMTQELNGDQGLSVCCGDDKFYKDILNEFIQDYADLSKKLYDLLENGNIELADAMLLDLIGITANIGADNIRRIALELKEAIKDTKEKSYVTLLENYEQHLQVLLQDIKEYI